MKLLDLPLAELLGAEVEVLDLQQRSPEWHASRARRYGASEAAAMLGLSPYMTRTELLRRKHTGLQQEHSDFVQEHVLDHGHAVEASIRAHVELVIGDDLSPVTCARRGTKLAASCDGLTLMRDTAWECKQWNEALAEQVRAGVVPDSHMPQCQQILLVTGAQRVIFSVSDGTPERTVSTEVKPDPAWFERILRGWQQFEADLQDYVPQEPTAAVVAAPVEALPAVSVRMDGALAVRSNLSEFGERLRAFVAQIPKAPSTDQEFADTDAACKALKRAEEALDGAESGALASIASVEDMRRTVATLRDIARSARLASEKVVAARKEQLREEAVAAGVKAVGDHIEMLRGLHGGYLVFNRASAAHEIGACIKGLKSLDSIRAAVDARAATLKIGATQVSDRIGVNLRTLAAAGEHAQALFADRAVLVQRDPDAVTAIVAQRLAEQRAAEERRLAAERERIRAEEAARAEAASRPATPAPTAPPVAPVAPAAPAAPAPVAAGPAPAADAPPVKLADLCDRLGWRLTAAEVSALGVATTKERATVLLAAADVPKLKAALRARVEAL